MLNSWVVSNGDSYTPNNEYGSGFVNITNKGVKSQSKPKFNTQTAKNMQDPTGRYLWLLSGSR